MEKLEIEIPDGAVISVVMGVCNGARYLPETIESVLCQTERNFEFIIVDDGSTDGDVAPILSDFENKDARIRIITKPNEGLTRALIDGCALARGRYIARIDAGDVMMPSRLKIQKEVLDRHPGISLVSSWTEMMGPEWEPLYVIRSRPSGEGGEDIRPVKPGTNCTDGPRHHASVMFRRQQYEAVGGYRWQFYYGQDWDLWYRLIDTGLYFCVPEVLTRVRIFPDSISGLNRRRQFAIGRWSLDAYWRRHQAFPEEAALAKAATIRPGYSGARGRRAIGEGNHFIGELLRRRGDPRCRAYFRQALKERPWRVNTCVRLIQSSRMAACY